MVLAAAIIICACDSYHRGIRATFAKYCCKSKNETDEKKNDENKEATEPNESMLDDWKLTSWFAKKSLYFHAYLLF